jgi:hypothetical protein
VDLVLVASFLVLVASFLAHEASRLRAARVLTLQDRGQQELPYRPMVVAHEHHMKADLTGYPKVVRPRTMSMFSKIVAVADGFDAATYRRSYQTDPLSPAAVLQEMRDNPRRGMDQVVVKAFINLVGHYPVGTLVVLDTFELAIVHATNQLPEAISRPIVRVVSDDKGNLLFPGHLIDLAQKDSNTGTYLRTIIKTADPELYDELEATSARIAVVGTLLVKTT